MVRRERMECSAQINQRRTAGLGEDSAGTKTVVAPDLQPERESEDAMGNAFRGFRFHDGMLQVRFFDEYEPRLSISGSDRRLHHRSHPTPERTDTQGTRGIALSRLSSS